MLHKTYDGGEFSYFKCLFDHSVQSILLIRDVQASNKDTERCNPLGWNHPNFLQQLGPRTHIVREGETFKSIATQLGDKHAALEFASINGYLMSMNSLKAGLILRIPQIIPSKNKAHHPLFSIKNQSHGDRHRIILFYFLFP